MSNQVNMDKVKRVAQLMDQKTGNEPTAEGWKIVHHQLVLRVDVGA